MNKNNMQDHNWVFPHLIDYTCSTLHRSWNRLIYTRLSLSLSFLNIPHVKALYTDSVLFLGEQNYSSPTSRFLPVALSGHSSPKIVLEFS